MARKIGDVKIAHNIAFSIGFRHRYCDIYDDIIKTK